MRLDLQANGKTATPIRLKTPATICMIPIMLNQLAPFTMRMHVLERMARQDTAVSTVEETIAANDTI